MIENIFYDIGNVLLKFNPNLPLEVSVAPIDANILLMKRLSTKYKIFAVTDATRELIDFETKNFDFFNNFQEVITSEESGFAKNDPEIYRFIVTKFNFAPEKCLFIDDKKENILAAKNIGIKTIHYINYDKSLLPGKRGPRYRSRRTALSIEKQVIEERLKGCNKYEINAILSVKLGSRTPSPSCIYKILKRYGMNKLNVAEKEEKRRIIKEKAGELGHIDCHHLSKDTISEDNKRYYLVCLIDSCTRIAWAEVVEDIKSISVMFASLHCLNYLSSEYNIKFAEVLTDNGPEFGPRESKQKQHHPFERLLTEIGIKHRYTRPYRPQTNGKVERFWRTLNEDLVNGTHFDSIEHFKQELHDYLLYYNKLRPHQALDGLTPQKFNQSCHRIT